MTYGSEYVPFDPNSLKPLTKADVYYIGEIGHTANWHMESVFLHNLYKKLKRSKPFLFKNKTMLEQTIILLASWRDHESR